jgi:hypothetical protein
MAETVYLLCALTSIACAVLLLRGFFTSRSPLLFWSGLCFVGLALNNVLLFVDVVIALDVDLSILRTSVGLAAVSVLVVGLVWDSR